MARNGEGTRNWQETPQKNEMGRLSLQRVYKKACGGRMAQCLMTFGVIGSIEPSSLTTPGGIMHPGLPPHTPYLGTPVVFPPGQRPVSFLCFGFCCKWKKCLAESANLSFRFTTAKHFFRFETSTSSSLAHSLRPNSLRTARHAA